MFSEQFSDNFPDEISRKKPPNPLLKKPNPCINSFKGPNKPVSFEAYPRNLILVNLILVNFFGCLVINRYRGGEFT